MTASTWLLNRRYERWRCPGSRPGTTTATVTTRWGRPDGTLHGKSELREHFRRGLEMAPGLRFAVLYRRDNGNRVIDAVELDGQNKLVRVGAFYAGKQV
jgi:hypothetical protein